MIKPSDVTCCLVTRGDHPEAIERIVDSLIFERIIIWDNGKDQDWKVAGRYCAVEDAQTRAVYLQDDDLLLPEATQFSLLDAYKPGVMVANWAHGSDPDGYDDLPLVGAGAIVDTDLPWKALERYLQHYDLDEAFMYEADFIAGALYERFEHVWLPFEIDMALAQDPSRLCNQPWQRDLKFDMTQRARAIRDKARVAA